VTSSWFFIPQLPLSNLHIPFMNNLIIIS